MSNVTDEWAAWMAAAGVPATTIGLRRYWVGRLERDHPGRGLLELTGRDLIGWLGGGVWAPATRKSVRSSVRSFYGWATDEGLIGVDPSARLPRVRTRRAVARPTPEFAFLEALGTADERVRLAAALAGYCGLRRGELAGLHSDDVMHLADGPALRVTGKGGHVRVVPLPEHLAGRLLERAPGWVFPSPSGGHLTPHHLGVLISRALGPDGGSTHGLRHRCATVAYRGTSDLRGVQLLLGHQRPETTAGYVLTELGAVRAAMAAAAG